MINKRTLRLYREFKALKRNRNKLTDEQYVKELETLLADFHADVDAPELSGEEIKSLFSLIAIKTK